MTETQRVTEGNGTNRAGQPNRLIILGNQDYCRREGEPRGTGGAHTKTVWSAQLQQHGTAHSSAPSHLERLAPRGRGENVTRFCQDTATNVLPAVALPAINTVSVTIPYFMHSPLSHCLFFCCHDLIGNFTGCKSFHYSITLYGHIQALH